MKKEFIIVFIKKTNQYGIAFNSSKHWKSEVLFNTVEMSKGNYMINEHFLWHMDKLNDLGYVFKGIVNVETEEDFWNLDE